MKILEANSRRFTVVLCCARSATRPTWHRLPLQPPPPQRLVRRPRASRPRPPPARQLLVCVSSVGISMTAASPPSQPPPPPPPRPPSGSSTLHLPFGWLRSIRPSPIYHHFIPRYWIWIYMLLRSFLIPLAACRCYIDFHLRLARGCPNTTMKTSSPSPSNGVRSPVDIQRQSLHRRQGWRR